MKVISIRQSGRVLTAVVVLMLLLAVATYVIKTTAPNTTASSKRPPVVNWVLLTPTPTPVPFPTPTPVPISTPPEVPDKNDVDITRVPTVPTKPPGPKPDQSPPAGTSITKSGGPDIGLSGNSDGLEIGSNSSGDGNPWDWYAGRAQAAITQALRDSQRTRGAVFDLEVRVWPDATGRVSRAKLRGSTGDPALDKFLQNDILTGLQLQSAPPAGMPTPIILRLSAMRRY